MGTSEEIIKELFEIPCDLISRFSVDESNLPDYRSQFMRDRDRVLYCTAFRRLAGKTQIYTIGEDDHKRNRLTHTLEVSQISRTIAGALCLNEDLAEAIALAHDFGHTPFGHAGEQMLHEIMIPYSKYIKDSPFYYSTYDNIKKVIDREMPENISSFDVNNIFGFKHNIQSARVAVSLEDSYHDTQGNNIGLNLTNYTLWGIMNHTNLKYNGTDSYPNYQNRFREYTKVKSSVSEYQVDAWSFEAYIVKIADEVAQWHHDLEDALRGGALPIKTICNTVLDSLNGKLSESDIIFLSNSNNELNIQLDRYTIARLSHVVINTLVNDIVEESKKNLLKIQNSLLSDRKNEDYKSLALDMYLDFEKTIGNKLKIQLSQVIAFSEQLSPDGFKKIIKGSVHHSREVERMNEKGKYIIRKLFEAYCSHPQQLPDGPILHFMVGINKYDNIRDARSDGIGKVRQHFQEVMKNPKLIYRIILMRRICDHIASMTDRYAIEEYDHLYG